MKPFVFHLLMPSCHAVRQTLWHRFAAVPLLFGAAMSVAQTPPPVYPQVGPPTDFISEDTVIGGFPELA